MMNREELKKTLKTPKGALIVLIVLAAAAGIVYGGHWFFWRLTHATTDAAYVKADIVNIAAEVPGKVVEVLVREGDSVKKGQVLYRIDPDQSDRKLALAEAEKETGLAKRERYRAELTHARASIPAAIDTARSALQASREQQVKAEANRLYWEKQHQRFKDLAEREVIGKARYDEVENAWKVARAELQTAQFQVKAAESRLAEAEASRALIGKAEAAFKEADEGTRQSEVSVRLARLGRSWCDVVAPQDGVVARRFAEAGDFASPGKLLVGIYNPATRYVEARFEETKLKYLVPGKEVDLYIDRSPGAPVKGIVQSIYPASAAEFAIIPRDVTAGEFTKVIQRIPVKIRIADLDKHPELFPGLSVEVAVQRSIL